MDPTPLNGSTPADAVESARITFADVQPTHADAWGFRFTKVTADTYKTASMFDSLQSLAAAGSEIELLRQNVSASAEKVESEIRQLNQRITPKLTQAQSRVLETEKQGLEVQLGMLNKRLETLEKMELRLVKMNQDLNAAQSSIVASRNHKGFRAFLDRLVLRFTVARLNRRMVKAQGRIQEIDRSFKQQCESQATTEIYVQSIIAEADRALEALPKQPEPVQTEPARPERKHGLFSGIKYKMHRHKQERVRETWTQQLLKSLRAPGMSEHVDRAEEALRQFEIPTEHTSTLLAELQEATQAEDPVEIMCEIYDILMLAVSKEELTAQEVLPALIKAASGLHQRTAELLDEVEAQKKCSPLMKAALKKELTDRQAALQRLSQHLLVNLIHHQQTDSPTLDFDEIREILGSLTEQALVLEEVSRNSSLLLGDVSASTRRSQARQLGRTEQMQRAETLVKQALHLAGSARRQALDLQQTQGYLSVLLEPVNQIAKDKTWSPPVTREVQGWVNMDRYRLGAAATELVMKTPELMEELGEAFQLDVEEPPSIKQLSRSLDNARKVKEEIIERTDDLYDQCEGISDFYAIVKSDRYQEQIRERAGEERDLYIECGGDAGYHDWYTDTPSAAGMGTLFQLLEETEKDRAKLQTFGSALRSTGVLSELPPDRKERVEKHLETIDEYAAELAELGRRAQLAFRHLQEDRLGGEDFDTMAYNVVASLIPVAYASEDKLQDRLEEDSPVANMVLLYPDLIEALQDLRALAPELSAIDEEWEHDLREEMLGWGADPRIVKNKVFAEICHIDTGLRQRMTGLLTGLKGSMTEGSDYTDGVNRIAEAVSDGMRQVNAMMDSRAKITEAQQAWALTSSPKVHKQLEEIADTFEQTLKEELDRGTRFDTAFGRLLADAHELIADVNIKGSQLDRKAVDRLLIQELKRKLQWRVRNTYAERMGFQQAGPDARAPAAARDDSSSSKKDSIVSSEETSSESGERRDEHASSSSDSASASHDWSNTWEPTREEVQYQHVASASASESSAASSSDASSSIYESEEEGLGSLSSSVSASEPYTPSASMEEPEDMVRQTPPPSAPVSARAEPGPEASQADERKFAIDMQTRIEAGLDVKLSNMTSRTADLLIKQRAQRLKDQIPGDAEDREQQLILADAQAACDVCLAVAKARGDQIIDGLQTRLTDAILTRAAVRKQGFTQQWQVEGWSRGRKMQATMLARRVLQSPAKGLSDEMIDQVGW